MSELVDAAWQQDPAKASGKRGASLMDGARGPEHGPPMGPATGGRIPSENNLFTFNIDI